MSISGFWRGAVYGISAAGIWGSMYVVSDIVLEVVPPFTLLSARVALALLILLPLSRRGTQAQTPAGATIKLLALGILGIGISLGAQFVGTDLSTAVNGALVTSASPAFVVLFAVVILRESLTLPRLFAIGLASAGVLVILDPASADFTSATFLGDCFLALAALTWGLYSVLLRQASMRYHLPALRLTVFALLGGLLVSLPGSLLELARRPLGQLDMGIALGIVYLGLVCTAFALLLWNRAFALVPATVASLFFFAQPLSGAILSAMFLDQRMTPSLWLGGLMIAIAVLLSLLRPGKDPATA